MSYTFRLSGTCNSNLGGYPLVSLPVPNSSNQYQSGSVYVFILNNVIIKEGRIAFLTAVGDGPANGVRFYYPDSAVEPGMQNGIFEFVATINYFTNAP